MKRPGRLIALGAGAFLVFLIVTLPAQLVIGQLRRFGVEASGISGSLWSGQAAALRSGSIHLGQLTWDLHVLQLLRGRASAQIVLRRSDGFAQGDIAATLTGRVLFNEFTASLPLSVFASAALPGWVGTVNLRLDTLALENGVPADVVGTVDALELAGPANRPMQIGSFRATFPAEQADGNEGVAGSVQDIEGPLLITGLIRLGPDRNYELNGRIATRPDAPAEVVNTLQYLGEPDAEGRRPFSLAGTY